MSADSRITGKENDIPQVHLTNKDRVQNVFVVTKQKIPSNILFGFYYWIYENTAVGDLKAWWYYVFE